MKRILIGIILGALAGIVIFLIAIPVSGEWELTLGVNGILLAVLGAVTDGFIGARKRGKK